MKINKKTIKQEGNINVLKDLGIYTDNIEEDKKQNKALRDFLITKGFPAPNISKNKK